MLKPIPSIFLRFAAAALLAFVAVVPIVSAQDDSNLPDKVVIDRQGLFPEGVEYDAQAGQFLVGSIAEGTIFAVQDNGSLSPFIEDSDLMSSIGIHIDTERGRLLVANTNSLVMQGQTPDGPQIMLGAYDLESGERLFMTDLTSIGPEGLHFANDVTVDSDGNAYVTDSFSTVIYQVDTDGNASVFAQDDRFASDSFGLNGIDFNPDGYLIVAKSSDGALFKVPLDDPTNVTQVELDQPVSGADGIALRPDGTLVVVGSPQTVFLVSSDDDWASATIEDTASLDQPATTAALRDDAVYVVFAHLDQMGSDTPPQRFEIVRAKFTGFSNQDDQGMQSDQDVQGDQSTQEPAESGNYNYN